MARYRDKVGLAVVVSDLARDDDEREASAKRKLARDDKREKVGEKKKLALLSTRNATRR